MRRKESVAVQCFWLGDPSISLKNPEGVKEEKRKQEVKRNSQEHEEVLRVQREKIQSGQKKDKRFEGEDGVRVLHQHKGARWARLSSGGMPSAEVRGGSHSSGRCSISKKSRDAAGRAAPGVRAAKF